MPFILPGEYLLTGVREMASSFLLEKDHRFRFFFYGALDRYASCTWQLQGKRLWLNSDREPDPGFSMVSSSRQADVQKAFGNCCI